MSLMPRPTIVKDISTRTPPVPFYLHKLKRFVERAFPQSYGALRERCHERLSYHILKTIAAPGLVVQSGPFEGMKYLPELLTSEKTIRYALLPKILGSYESELHDLVARVRERAYTKVVNIGCSEGYYAVGFSLLLSRTSVFAFDIDHEARHLCEQMANLNSVQDRLVVDAECTTEHLEVLCGPRTLIVCDCEGCEFELLRPDLVPNLRACDIIVELHDCVKSNISKAIPDRFARTHEVTMILERERDPSAFATLRGLCPYKQRLAVSETRWGAPGVWSFMTAMQDAQF